MPLAYQPDVLGMPDSLWDEFLGRIRGTQGHGGEQLFDSIPLHAP